MRQNRAHGTRELVISVGPKKSREYVYTNKVSAHFSGETSGEVTRSYHGLCVKMHKLLENWRFQVDGQDVNPTQAREVLVYPHQLVRIFQHPALREKICLLDGRDILVVELEGHTGTQAALWPLVDLRPARQVVKPDYLIQWRFQDNLLFVRAVPKGNSHSVVPLWLGVTANLPLHFCRQERYVPTAYLRGQRRGVMGKGTPFEPGRLEFRPQGRSVRFLFLAGRTRREVRRAAARALEAAPELMRRKERRQQRLLSRCSFQCGDARFNIALAWARISLDALVMSQQGRGIYAGLPWFANYWGRDTGICLPGATWVTGQFALARSILQALARQQDRRRGSRTEGRIPNVIEPGTKFYNTADGTLWFIRQVMEYIRYSGDIKTARGLFPAVARAIQGEITQRTDERGFVIHGAAETWMDAGGDKNPLTPRDNRAVEIQVLWHTALLSGAQLANLVGHTALSARWTRIARRVARNFMDKFWDPVEQRLYDHLNPDHTADEQIRPNGLLALTIPFEPLLAPDQERALLDHVIANLVYPYGVSSLIPEDPQFRPRHLSDGRYHFDEAYHNGDVWLWLTGPLISGLVRHGRQKTAYLLTEVLTDHLLNKGAVGTLSELFNAVPTKEDDNEAGTYTQAWSLAEYIRVAFQDYLGVRPDALSHRVTVEPAVPAAWGDVVFQFAIAETMVETRYMSAGSSRWYIFQAGYLHRPLCLTLRARVPGGKLLCIDRPLTSRGRLEIQVLPHGHGWRALANGKAVSFSLLGTDFDVSRGEKAAFRKPPVLNEMQPDFRATESSLSEPTGH